MTGYIEPRIFNIEPSQPFLVTLAAALCEGNLVPGFSYNGEPLELARVTIFVPTRRAARELRSSFMDYLGQTSVLLPRIRTLGEFDEEHIFFEGDANNFIKTPPPIDSLERQLILGQMIAGWTKHLKDYLQRYFEGEEFTTPVSTSDAFWLANDLAGLLDALQTEDISFDDILLAGEAETSDWWQVTLAFLTIIKDEWPKILEERKRIDPATHRNAMLRGEAERLFQLQPKDPVIVAGSTGTIAATADLIGVVSKLPAGAIVLPGYDLGMSDKTKELLEDPNEFASAVGHPQFGMHRLVKKIGASSLVRQLGSTVNAAQTQRKNWIAAALEPAPRTESWNNVRPDLAPDAFADVEVLVANNEREEAAAIAAALREAIADKEATTALVTPDRMLARRVVTELARYGIVADDSGGRPFEATNHGSLIGFAFKNMFEKNQDPAALLALLKNPLVQIGVDSAQHLSDLFWLERLVLRGGVDRIDLNNFTAFALRQIEAWDKRSFRPKWYASIIDENRAAALAIAGRIEAASAPLCAYASRTGEAPLRQAIEASVQTLEALCADQEGIHRALYDGEAGAMLRATLTQFLTCDTALRIEPAQWPEIFRAISSSLLVKPKHGGHPRVAIWGALEARLQTVDFMVLGSLNEGSWPQQTSNDAFLTRGMKTRMNMQPPERRIGLAAHDFQMAMGQKRVLLTRSARQENAPTVASRWLQRLETLAGATATQTMRRAGQRYVEILSGLETPADKNPVERPQPTPPIEARPTHFSVTEIERLRRDPYALYAKKILGLYPNEKLVRDPDASERGTLIHKILEEATNAKIDFADQSAPTALSQIADAVFDEAQLPEEIEIVWRARFDAAIPELIDFEIRRDSYGVKRYAELSAEYLAIDDTGVTLGGRADRMDVRSDGRVDIIDYKTGGAPSAKQVKAMLAPQMPLEAALLNRGAFAKLGEAHAAALLYVTLSAAGKVKDADVCGNGKNGLDANELADKAWGKLVNILQFYAEENNGYISRAIPKLEHDYSDEYDHLARVMEWSAGVDSDGDAGDAS